MDLGLQAGSGGLSRTSALKAEVGPSTSIGSGGGRPRWHPAVLLVLGFGGRGRLGSGVGVTVGVPPSGGVGPRSGVGPALGFFAHGL